MKGVNNKARLNSNTANNVGNVSNVGNGERRLKMRINNRNHEEFLHPLNEENFNSVNNIILTKSMVNTTTSKNNRTFSLDLTGSINNAGAFQAKKNLEEKQHVGNNNNNTNNILTEANVLSSLNLGSNFTALFKEFGLKHKKKFRTNSIALYNMTDYNTNGNKDNKDINCYLSVGNTVTNTNPANTNHVNTVNTVTSTNPVNTVPSIANPIITTQGNNNNNTHQNNTHQSLSQTVSKKLLGKSQSGNATSFNKYLTNVNKVKSNNFESVNKSIAVSGVGNIMSSCGANVSVNYATPFNLFTGVTGVSSITKNTVNSNNSNNAGNGNSISNTNSSFYKTSNKNQMQSSFPKYTTSNKNTKSSKSSQGHKGSQSKATSKPKVPNHSNLFSKSKLTVPSSLNQSQIIQNNNQSNTQNNPPHGQNNKYSQFPLQDPKSTNSLNISRDYNKSRTSKTPEEIDLNEEEYPLSNETKRKLNEIKNLIVELLNSSRNKNVILKELEGIYKYVLKVNSPISSTCDEEMSNCNSYTRKSLVSSSNSFTASNNFNLSQMRSSKRNYSEKEVHLIDMENEILRRENELLKSKMEVFDRRFDKICTENSDLRDYVKEKTENLEDLRSVLDSFKVELDEVKKQSTQNNKDNKMNMSNNINNMSNNINLNHNYNQSNSNYRSINNLIINSNTKDNLMIQTLSDKADLSMDECNECDNTNNSKKYNTEANINHTPHFTVMPKLKFDSSPNNEDELIGVIPVAENEKTGCFADFMNKKESNETNTIVSNSNFDQRENDSGLLNEEEFSVDLDSLNRMNILLDEKEKMSKISHNKEKGFSSNNSSNIHTPKTFGLNFANLPRQDFNDEFMENYSDFSPSWRKEVEKINLTKKKK